MLDHRRVFDACYDLDSPTACFTGRNIDSEHSFQGNRPFQAVVFTGLTISILFPFELVSK